jgi:hypothetical protein
MTDEPRDHADDEPEEQDRALGPWHEATPLTNPAPGDMPVDPPAEPKPFGPLDDIS